MRPFLQQLGFGWGKGPLSIILISFAVAKAMRFHSFYILFRCSSYNHLGPNMILTSFKLMAESFKTDS